MVWENKEGIKQGLVSIGTVCEKILNISIVK